MLYNCLVWIRQNRQKLKILGGIGTLGSSYYIYHLEKAPITGRIRFININSTEENAIAQKSADEIISTNRSKLLSPNHPVCLRINSIVKNLANNLSKFLPGMEVNFRTYVIESSEPNAFVLPGGQIFVNTGLLPVAQNDEGLATILAHEIAHKIARHGAEKMSTYQFFSIVIETAQFILTGEMNNPFANIMKTVVLELPFSRKCETEADYIGLLLMAGSCFNPEEAVNLWTRMAAQSKQNSKLSHFLSTHPSNSKRIENIKSWLPEATKIYENSECGIVYNWRN